jgi:hypothetical protein
MGIYSFSHLTFQEYFTAKKIVASSNPEIIKSLLTEKRWREVYLLAGELNWNGDTLLLLKQQNRERFDEWWQKEYQAWIEQLRAVRIPDFNGGQDGKLSQHLKNALKRYYEFNKYLIDRLNISCQVTSEVRAQIEDTLLLPIAEIEKRKHGQ